MWIQIDDLRKIQENECSETLKIQEKVQYYMKNLDANELKLLCEFMEALNTSKDKQELEI